MLKSFRKIIHRIQLFNYHKHVYGFSYAFWSLCHSFDRRLGLLFNSIINKKRDKAIIKYLSTEYADLIKEFAARPIAENNKKISPSSTIWMCWWQGLEQMPDIVKACYISIQKHAGTHPIRVITKNNFQEFITLPHHIMEKFNSGLISITHLSDIIRVNLLYEYGGFWLDATMFSTKDISIEDQPFFTLKGTYKADNITQARWTGFCIAGLKHNILFEYIKKYFYLYWETHNELIDYVLIDYIIETAYRSIPHIKSLLNGVAYNNTDIYSLQYHLHNEFSQDLFAEYCSQTSFHKLTWKKNHEKYTPGNKLTFYGYLIETYLRENKK
jgi:hypothetical protein